MLDHTSQARWSAAVLVAGALIASGCSGGGGGGAGEEPTDAQPDEEVVVVDEPASGDGEDDEAAEDEAPDRTVYPLDHLDEVTRWAATFTGGPGVEATGDPVRFGYVHDGELAPQHLPAAIAAVEYVNEHLGGVAGRPLEMVVCDPSVPRLDTEVDPETEEEVEVEVTCDIDLAEDDDLVMVVSQTRTGTAELYEALADIKPVLVASPGDVTELTSDSVSTYLAGTLTTGGMGIWALSLELESAVALLTDNTAGRDGFTMLEPMFAAEGVELLPIWITPTTSASRVESRLASVGVADADLLILGLDEPGCVAAVEALDELGVDGTANIIISASTCLRPGVRNALLDAEFGFEIPANWHFATNGFNPFDPTIESGYVTLDEVLDGPLRPDHVGDAGVEAAVVSILSMTRALNRADGDLSFETLDDLLRNPGVPVPTQAGDQDCGRSPAFTPVCAGRVGIIQFAGGSWIDVAVADTAIDLDQILFPPGR